MKMTRGRIVGAAIVAPVATSVTVATRIPARLVVASDTLIVNGEQPVLVGAQLLGRTRDLASRFQI
jgi:hypothetical protein